MRNHQNIIEKVSAARADAQTKILDYQNDSIPTSRYGPAAYAARQGRINALIPILHAAHMTLPGFATIDAALVPAILSLIDGVEEYIQDPTLRRPYNILMIAPPGSGKSHFIECLAKTLAVPHIVANLSAENHNDIIAYALNEARNFKSQDRRPPLIFLDEVDSKKNLVSLLLPLLWEGQFSTTGQTLRVGKCILICAASSSPFERLPTSEKVKPPLDEYPKLPDFLSRLNGGRFRIGKLDSQGRGLDRLAIVASLIQRRFETVDAVSVGLLQFLARVQVQHEVRSLEFLINLIPRTAVQDWPLSPSSKESNGVPVGDDILYPKFLRLLESSDRFGSALGYHILDDDRPEAVALWKRMNKNVDPLYIHE